MASKAMSSTALILTINLLFFTIVTSTNCPPPPKHHPKPSPTPSKPTPSPSKPSPTPSKPTPSPSKPSPSPSKPSPSPPKATCPKDTLKLGVCGDVLSGLINIVVGTPPKTQCCSLLEGLTDLEAAVCLCTAIKASVLGINLDIPVSLTLLLNYCDKKVPSGYECA